MIKTYTTYKRTYTFTYIGVLACVFVNKYKFGVLAYELCMQLSNAFLYDKSKMNMLLSYFTDISSIHLKLFYLFTHTYDMTRFTISVFVLSFVKHLKKSKHIVNYKYEDNKSLTTKSKTTTIATLLMIKLQYVVLHISVSKIDRLVLYNLRFPSSLLFSVNKLENLYE